jgi:hypothetical protein
LVGFARVAGRPRAPLRRPPGLAAAAKTSHNLRATRPSASLADVAVLEMTMQLIAVYLVLIVIGDFIAYGIGTAVQQVSEAASLPIFLALYFFVFFIAWVIAVRVTEPRKAQEKINL